MSMRSPSIVSKSALLIALPCLVLSGCKEKQPESVPATALVAPVTRGDLASTLSVAGEFQPYQEVELHAKVSGYIRRINVDIGDRVRTGQVIATLEVPELNAQVAASQAGIRHSQSEIARAENEVTLAQGELRGTPRGVYAPVGGVQTSPRSDCGTGAGRLSRQRSGCGTQRSMLLSQPWKRRRNNWVYRERKISACSHWRTTPS